MAIAMNAATDSVGNSALIKHKFSRDGLLALALALLVLVLLVAAIAIPAVLLHRYYDDRLFSMNKKIATFDRANAQRASLLEKREELRSQDSRKYYLKAATPALASAELQDAVKAIIEGAVGQGQVQNTQVAAPKDDGLVRNVSANFIFQTSMPNVRKILYAIETAQPYLLVDNLTLRATVGSNHKSNPGQEPMVFVQFDVAGVGLVNTAPAASAAVPSGANVNANTATGNIATPSAASVTALQVVPNGKPAALTAPAAPAKHSVGVKP